MTRRAILLAVAAALAAGPAAAADNGRGGRGRLTRGLLPAPAGPVRPDRQGDALPPGAVARFGSARLLHGGGIGQLVFSPDGKQLLSVVTGNGSSLKLWEAATGKELARLDRPAEAAAVSPEGWVVVAFGGQGGVWTPANGTFRPFEPNVLPAGTETLDVGPDGRTVAALGSTEAALIDAPTGAVKAAFVVPPTPGRDPHRVRFSPDGRWLAAAAEKTGIWLWDLKTLRRVRTYPAGTDRPEFVFSPDGARLAVATDKVQVYVTDAEEPDDAFEPVDGAALDLRFTADGKELVLLRQDGHVVRVNAKTGKEVATQNPPSPDLSPSAALAPGGVMAALTDSSDRIWVWDPKTGKGPTADRFGVLSDPGFAADGSASCADGLGTVRTFDPKTGAAGKSHKLTEEAGSLLAWDARSGRAVVRAVGTTPREVRLVEAATGKVLAKHPLGDSDQVWAAFQTGSGDRFAVVADGVVTVVDAAAGRAVGSVPVGQPENVHGAVVSPDGRLVAATTEPLSVWEVGTGRRRFEVPAVPDPDGVAFSPDGKLLAAWDGSDLTVFDVRAGAVVRRLRNPGPDAMYRAVAFSPDGSRLAAGGDDGAVVVWDMATGGPVYGLDRHEGSVFGLAFAPDGKTLVTAGDDGTCLVWDVSAPPAARAGVPTAEEAVKLLGATDPEEAHRGMAFLYAKPEEAVRRLGELIPVAQAVDAAKVDRLVGDLGSDEFPVRQTAVKGLEAVGGQAAPALRRAVGKPATPEAAKLAGELLKKADGPAARPADLAAVRAVEVLEAIGTPAALAVLAKWAAGPPGERLTTEAAAVTKRPPKSGR